MRANFLLSFSIAFLSLSCMVLVTFVLIGTGPNLLSLKAHAESPSFVRVVHASPDVGTADVFVDGTKLLSNFQFGTVTGYVPLPAGPHKVQVALIGKGVGAAVISQTISPEPGQVYTVAALGTQANGFSLVVFNDNNQVSAGKAKMRVYNLSPDTQLGSVTAANEQLISQLPYKECSDYFALNAGSYTFNINTTDNQSLAPFSADLNSDSVISLFAVGLRNGTPKLQFVSARANGLPGMPGTGSDPNAIPEQDGIQRATFVLVFAAVLAGLALSVFMRRQLMQRIH